MRREWPGGQSCAESRHQPFAVCPLPNWARWAGQPGMQLRVKNGEGETGENYCGSGGGRGQTLGLQPCMSFLRPKGSIILKN